RTSEVWNDFELGVLAAHGFSEVLRIDRDIAIAFDEAHDVFGGRSLGLVKWQLYINAAISTGSCQRDNRFSRWRLTPVHADLDSGLQFYGSGSWRDPDVVGIRFDAEVEGLTAAIEHLNVTCRVRIVGNELGQRRVAHASWPSVARALNCDP